MFRALALCFCLFAAACTTTDQKFADRGAPRPAPGARILLVEPDVQLSVLTMAGLDEPRADWSKSAQANLDAAMQAALRQRSHQFRELDPATAQEGRIGQLLRLHEAVGRSILAFSYGQIDLPTKRKRFEWTLGEGAQALGRQYGADYALFTYGRGSYSSGGRKVAMVGMALLGAGIMPLGGQEAFASLVDLRTGRVVWFNVAKAAPTADMRDPEGAQAFVDAIMKDAPL
ncbi:MAG: hypothetical protein KY449_09920 [Proteobacteria bacterium]|nr:hypothetical protein [Pseudomonadota bacterium]